MDVASREIFMTLESELVTVIGCETDRKSYVIISFADKSLEFILLCILRLWLFKSMVKTRTIDMDINKKRISIDGNETKRE